MHYKLLAVPLILRNFALREQSFSEFIILVVVVRGIDIEGHFHKFICTYVGTKTLARVPASRGKRAFA
jgi:hypothetical protein